MGRKTETAKLNCIIKVCFFQNLPVQIELLLLQIQVSLHNNVAV